VAPTGSADYADRMSADPSPLFGSSFEPTPGVVRARLDAVDPDAYARTRNALDGAVTRLSPYAHPHPYLLIVIGIIFLRVCLAELHACRPSDAMR